jgi:hypothetical protein
VERIVKNGIVSLAPSGHPEAAEELDERERPLTIPLSKHQPDAGRMGYLLSQPEDLLLA